MVIMRPYLTGRDVLVFAILQLYRPAPGRCHRVCAGLSGTAAGESGAGMRAEGYAVVRERKYSRQRKGIFAVGASRPDARRPAVRSRVISAAVFVIAATSIMEKR